MRTHTFVIKGLDKRHPGLTPAVAGAYSEAAYVCLDRHHTSPVILSVARGEDSCKGITAWEATDPRTKSAWANETDATEAGAYCVALVTIEATDGLVAVRRAEGLTGADYYLGQPGQIVQDLEKSHRLEVSGVDKGEMTVLRTRLAQKVTQAREGKSNLPAIAVVVGFATMAVLTQDVDVNADVE